jgi:Mg-chelatase subunit ChlD
MPMARPDRTKAASALASMEARGGTPIGNAMITAKRELDATGLTRRHLLVVTDGENTGGYEPERVATAINRRPEAERPSLYFVAFDIEASRFRQVRDAGGLVLGAANAKELNATLDSLLRGQILLEK